MLKLSRHVCFVNFGVGWGDVNVLGWVMLTLFTYTLMYRFTNIDIFTYRDISDTHTHIYISLSVVSHKVVAEVSKKGNL